MWLMMRNLRLWMMLAVTILALLSCQETCGEENIPLPGYPGDNASPEVRAEYFRRLYLQEIRKHYEPQRRDIMDAEAWAINGV